MQFQFILNPATSPSSEKILVAGREIPLLWICNPRARRYVLRLRRDGSARVTIPRSGSPSGARAFVNQHLPWLERQLQWLASRPARPVEWHIGTEVWFRGELLKIEASENNHVRVGTELIRILDPAADLRAPIEKQWRRMAAAELPPRVHEFAAQHGIIVSRVMVRAQRTRWGSCSPTGTISLNWRLIQTPPFVRDYIILHELAHRREMNHSGRFWKVVEEFCPEYKTAERWIKEHPGLLR